MKSALLYSLIATLSLSGLNAYAKDTCATGGGQAGGGYGGPYGPAVNDPYFPNAATVPAIYPSPVSAAPTTPQARVTVVDSEPLASAGGPSATRTSSARLTVVDDAPVFASKPEPKLADVAIPAIESDSAKEKTAAIDDALKGLVGTWKAVARHGDGELTTVELQLDDRGWAELTVPGADGARSTIKRRVELKNEELKLTSPDSELSLGKLITFNTRQMVLERSGGQVTFVRP